MVFWGKHAYILACYFKAQRSETRHFRFMILFLSIPWDGEGTG